MAVRFSIRVWNVITRLYIPDFFSKLADRAGLVVIKGFLRRSAIFSYMLELTYVMVES